MKRFVSIFLCIIMCLTFVSCSVNSNQKQVNLKEKYDYSEDYISMYRANNYHIYGELSFNSVRAKNGKYYFNTGNKRGDIYELTALEFNKSCENRNLMYIDSDWNWVYNYGNKFISSDNSEDNEIDLLQTYKNYLYVLIDSSIYKINCDNAEDCSKIYSVNEDDYIGTFFFYKDEMYITSSNEDKVVIARSDLNGNILSEVINGGAGFASARDDELYNIYASNDYLYFMMRNDGFESNTFLYCRCKLDGSEKEVWNILDVEPAIISASEKNIAVVRRNVDLEMESGSGLSVEIYDSKDLTLIKDFSVDLNDDMNEILEDEFYFPVFYKQGSIEIDMAFETYNMLDFHSEKLTIDTKSELAQISSIKGIIERTSYDDIFSIAFEQTGEESANLYFYKVDNSEIE